MPKPTSPTLNTGNALGALITHAWPLAVGTGATLADLAPSGASAGTLSGVAGTNYSWGTDADGALLSLLTAGTRAALATPVTLSGSAWSIAWRANQATSGNQGIVLGNTADGSSFLWMRSGTELRLRVNFDEAAFPAPADYSSISNYVLTYNGSAVRLYRDGAEVSGSPQTPGTLGTMTISALGHGHTSDTLSLIGDLGYVYLFGGTALSAAQAASLAADPYQVLSGSGGGPSRVASLVGGACVPGLGPAGYAY